MQSNASRQLSISKQPCELKETSAPKQFSTSKQLNASREPSASRLPIAIKQPSRFEHSSVPKQSSGLKHSATSFQQTDAIFKQPDYSSLRAENVAVSHLGTDDARVVSHRSAVLMESPDDILDLRFDDWLERQAAPETPYDPWLRDRLTSQRTSAIIKTKQADGRPRSNSMSSVATRPIPPLHPHRVRFEDMSMSAKARIMTPAGGNTLELQDFRLPNVPIMDFSDLDVTTYERFVPEIWRTTFIASEVPKEDRRVKENPVSSDSILTRKRPVARKLPEDLYGIARHLRSIKEDSPPSYGSYDSPFGSTSSEAATVFSQSEVETVGLMQYKNYKDVGLRRIRSLDFL
ncbi:MAG: hypothetical protein Q9220_004984 [cf. Caloplaca sp. 1 TL-2023]